MAGTSSDIAYESTIKCPKCGFTKTEPMPANSCTYFYECTSCNTVLKPIEGDCCVFCSYGDQLCPPVQEKGSCCS